MFELPFGDWITAILTVTYIQLLAFNKKLGWPVGAFTQLIWIYITIYNNLYGLTVLSIVLMCQFLYGWWKNK